MTGCVGLLGEKSDRQNSFFPIQACQLSEYIASTVKIYYFSSVLPLILKTLLGKKIVSTHHDIRQTFFSTIERRRRERGGQERGGEHICARICNSERRG